VNTPMLDAALAYAAKGWAVLPIAPNTKRPLSAHGVKDATTDPVTIAGWWTATPDANIGIAAGAGSGITVLDIDDKSGKNGFATLDRLGATDRPGTVWQATPSGGTQEIYRHDPRITNRVGGTATEFTGLDTRNDGGYVLVPPSTIDGKPYQWIARPFGSTQLAPFPEALVEVFQSKTCPKVARPSSEWRAVVAGVDYGSRQEELPRVIGKFIRDAHGDIDIPRTQARGYGRGCDPELTEQEVDECFDRIWAKEAAKPKTGDVAADDPGGERYTDGRNAELIAEETAGKVCHVDEMKEKWFVYDDTKWRLLSKKALVPHTKVISQRLFTEAKALYAEADQRAKDLAASVGNLTGDSAAVAKSEIDATRRRADLRKSGAMRLENKEGKYAAIELAKAEPALSVDIEQLDAHPRWLNLPNGTLDLESGELHAHRADDYLTKVAGVAYDPEATCPRWDAFLAEVVPDPEVRAFLQRSVGYAMTDSTSEQCLWFLYGVGRNGKTTFVNACGRCSAITRRTPRRQR
jgi:putative DNA primase/helicase